MTSPIDANLISAGFEALLTRLAAIDESALSPAEVLAMQTIVFSAEPINMDRWDDSLDEIECDDFGHLEAFPGDLADYLRAIDALGLVTWLQGDDEDDDDDDEGHQVGLVTLPSPLEEVFQPANDRIREIGGEPAEWVMILQFLYICLDQSEFEEGFLSAVKATCIDGREELIAWGAGA
jgi:hypothetical protein